MKKLFLGFICFLLIGVFTQTATGQTGCSNYLGRAGEKLCSSKAAYDECVKLLKEGKIAFCVLSGDQNSSIRRATTGEAHEDLLKRGCNLTSKGVYDCPGTLGFNTCIAYKNFGAVSDCKMNATPVSSGNIYVYAPGQDNALWHNKYANGKWSGWQSFGGNGIGGVDACSPNPGKMVVALRNTDNSVGAAIFNFDKSSNPAWFHYGSKIGSDPAVACRAGDRLNLYARGHNNTGLYGTWAENGIWANLYVIEKGDGLAIEDVVGKANRKPSEKSFWDKIGETIAGKAFTYSSEILGAVGLGGQMKGSPDACSFGGDKQAVFVRGMDDAIYWKMWDGSKWSEFESLEGGVKMSSDPSALSRRSGEIMLFARGTDNKLWVREYRNGQWGAWLPWGGVLAGSPKATSWGGNRIDVFARSADGSILHAWRDDTDALIKTPQWENIGGKISTDLTAVGVKW
jgi:hypothetical protein